MARMERAIVKEVRLCMQVHESMHVPSFWTLCVNKCSCETTNALLQNMHDAPETSLHVTSLLYNTLTRNLN